MLKHPIPMKTVFRRCFLVNFAFSEDTLRALLPAPIVPDAYGGEAYVSVVIAELEKMRPAFVPRALGVTYTQVVHRAVVRCGDERGVYFLRSDADDRLMCAFGDWLTFFQFHFAKIDWQIDKERISFALDPEKDEASIRARFDLASGSRVLPASSRFSSMAHAQEHLVELYSAFGKDARGRTCRVRIDRAAWDVTAIHDFTGAFTFMQRHAPFAASARLDSVFYVRDLPYLWHTLEHVN